MADSGQKVVLITGCSSGIGLRIAVTLAKDEKQRYHGKCLLFSPPPPSLIGTLSDLGVRGAALPATHCSSRPHEVGALCGIMRTPLEQLNPTHVGVVLFCQD